MTAPTHVAFACAAGMMCGTPAYAVKLLAAGSILPDIDHPQSFIGKVFFFISYPLNKLFGHRKTIHSMILWVPIVLLGFLTWDPIGWIGLGAITHILIDCLNTSGVLLFHPLSEKIFVLATRKYRVNVCSKQEYVIMALCGAIAWGGGYIGSMGGLRTFIGTLTGAYNIALTHYESAGENKCYFSGAIREPHGVVKKGEWLVIGTETNNGVAVYDEKNEEVIHVPKDGKFLRVKLKKTPEKWNTIELTGMAEVEEGIVFYRVKNNWAKANPKDIVSGYVIYSGDAQMRTFNYDNVLRQEDM